jgi:hypothetical protein
MCDSFISTMSFGNDSHADKYLAMFELGTDIYVGLYAKYLLFMSDFNRNWNVSAHFNKKRKAVSVLNQLSNTP